MTNFIVTDSTGRKYWNGSRWTLVRTDAVSYVRSKADMVASRVGGTTEQLSDGYIL